MRVFVLGPQGVVDVVTKAGHDALVPPPRPAPGLSQAEKQWFIATFDRMMEADMMVADASAANAGDVGWATAWFLAKGRLVVLACHRDARGALSPLLGGNPSPWCRLALYDDEEGRATALLDALDARRS